MTDVPPVVWDYIEGLKSHDVGRIASTVSDDLVFVSAGRTLDKSQFLDMLVFLVESRFAGFGLIDFPLEYRGYSVGDSIAYAKSHRGEATGLGAGYFLLMMIPVIGWMIAPTFGTVAGTVKPM